MRERNCKKSWYFFGSVFFHVMLVNVFAAGPQPFSVNLIPFSKTISVELDLDARLPAEISKPAATESRAVKPDEQREATKKEPQAISSQKDLEELNQKRAELDRRIKAIREKLKRTVKAQQLKRTAEVQKGFQLLSTDRQGAEWELYLKEIREKVLRCWYPKLIRAEDQLIRSEAQLNFEIFLDGRVKSFEIANWKGSEEFKKISLEAFREAIPFQPYGKAVSSAKKSKSYFLTLYFYYQ